MRIFLLVVSSICFILSSCDTGDTLEEVDLHRFFWRIDDYDTAKVLEYDCDSFGVKTKFYFKLEKISNDELQITGYNAKKRKAEILIDKFTDSQVYLKSSIVAEQYSPPVFITSEIDSSKLFSFDSAHDQLFIASKTRLKSDSTVSFTSLDKWRLEEIVNKPFLGEEKPTIVARGNSERAVNVFGQPTINQTRKHEIWYCEGFGISFMKQTYAEGSFSFRYVGELSTIGFE